MPITFTCRCGNTLRTADSNAGKPGKCPACSMPFIVPQTDGRAEAASHADDSDYPLRRVKRQPVRERSRFDGLTADDVQLRPRLSDEDEEQKAERRAHRMPHAVGESDEGDEEQPRRPRTRAIAMFAAGAVMMVGSGVWFRVMAELGHDVPVVPAPFIFAAGLVLAVFGGFRYYLQR